MESRVSDISMRSAISRCSLDSDGARGSVDITDANGKAISSFSPDSDGARGSVDIELSPTSSRGNVGIIDAPEEGRVAPRDGMRAKVAQTETVTGEQEEEKGPINAMLGWLPTTDHLPDFSIRRDSWVGSVLSAASEVEAAFLQDDK
jgi:hypothetical protein